MLEKISTELQQVLPEVVVEFDEAKMQGFKSLDYKDKTVCYIEEYRSGSYDTATYGLHRTDSLTLYIYDSGDGKPDNALKREEDRTVLEEKVVLPLITYYGDRISNIRYRVTASRFNSLETGLYLTFDLREEICL